MTNANTQPKPVKSDKFVRVESSMSIIGAAATVAATPWPGVALVLAGLTVVVLIYHIVRTWPAGKTWIPWLAATAAAAAAGAVIATLAVHPDARETVVTTGLPTPQPAREATIDEPRDGSTVSRDVVFAGRLGDADQEDNTVLAIAHCRSTCYLYSSVERVGTASWRRKTELGPVNLESGVLFTVRLYRFNTTMYELLMEKKDGLIANQKWTGFDASKWPAPVAQITVTRS